MAFIEPDAVFEKFKKLGSNSSHFVWMLAKLKFYETAEGFVFGFVTRKDVILLALEPLIPDEALSLEKAWNEFKGAVPGQVYSFVSIYEPFVKKLRPLGFGTVPIGSEPWVKLSEHLPTGNSGRGVRSARNQALKSGLRVEEWSFVAIASDPEKRATLHAIHEDWSSARWIQLEGFTLATDAFSHMESRRYFVVSSGTRVEGYLVASPVPLTQSHYLEDIIIRRSAPKGCGELLTLESMAVLYRDGGFEASRGVVAASHVKPDELKDLPGLIRFLLITVPNQLKAFYNLDGQEMYRKRFKPHRWAKVHLAVHTVPGSPVTPVRAWILTFIALAIAFQPRLSVRPATFKAILQRPLRRYPLTFALAGVSILAFIFVNHAGPIPYATMARYAFSPDAPASEWLLRSLTSDFLYATPINFYVCLTTLIAVTAWAERTQKRSFLVPLVLSTIMLDDVFNYWILIRPLQTFQPELFGRLIQTQDVGGSLLISSLLGLQLCKLREKREIIFSAVALSSVLAFAYSSREYAGFFLNLNHFLFLLTGFVIGKLRFEVDRAHSRRVAKGKTPESTLLATSPVRIPIQTKPSERKAS